MGIPKDFLGPVHLLATLKEHEPFAFGRNSETKEFISIFEPFWEDDGRFPVRVTYRGKMRNAIVVHRDHIANALPFPYKDEIYKKYFKRNNK